MKKIVFSATVLLGIASVHLSTAQANTRSGIEANSNTSGNVVMLGQDVQFENSPYLSDTFQEAVIMYKDEKLSKLMIRFNTYSNDLEYQQDGNNFTLTEPTIVGFRLPDGSIFRRGFQNLDRKQTNLTFYQILSEGNLSLVKYPHSRMQNKTQYNQATKLYAYVSDESFYLAKMDGTLVKVKKDKKSVFEAIPDKKEQLEEYLSKENLKLNNWENIIKLLKYYNSI